MHNFNQHVLQLIADIELEMQRSALWQSLPPQPEVFLSQQPFALDMMSCHEWLQWIFIPKIRAIIDENAPFPRNFALHPYFEQTLKGQEEAFALLSLIRRLDELVKE